MRERDSERERERERKRALHVELSGASCFGLKESVWQQAVERPVSWISHCAGTPARQLLQTLLPQVQKEPAITGNRAPATSSVPAARQPKKGACVETSKLPTQTCKTPGFKKRRHGAPDPAAKHLAVFSGEPNRRLGCLFADSLTRRPGVAMSTCRYGAATGLHYDSYASVFSDTG